MLVQRNHFKELQGVITCYQMILECKGEPTLRYNSGDAAKRVQGREGRGLGVE